MNNNQTKLSIRSRILKHLLRESISDAALDDFSEQFLYIASKRGRFIAHIWFWLQILGLVPTALKESIHWRFVMLLNHLKIALRIIKRNKGFSFINISGLAIGIACCVLILLWVQDELSFDAFHTNGENIYRIVSKDTAKGITQYYAVNPMPLAPTLKAEYPEVLRATRYSSSGIRFYHKDKDESFVENGCMADPDFLQMFSFPLIKGDLNSALTDPFSIVLTEKLANKYFGSQNPVGKVLSTLRGTEFQVNGIIQDVPHNSHLQFDFIIPFEIMGKYGADLNNWEDVSYLSYVMLHEESSITGVNKKIRDTEHKHRKNSTADRYLQPLKDVHLRSHFKFDIPGHGDIKYVYIFSFTAFFVLIIACINFMNLTTARSANRVREIGVRKVVGAYKKDIIKQFFGETFLFTLLASVLSILIILLFLPSFRTLSGKPLFFSFTSNPWIFAELFGIVFFSGVLSGIYPSLYLSKFQPVKVLRGLMKSGTKGSVLRRVLVVSQFTLSIILIIGTIVIFNQIKYMRNANLGYDTDHLLFLPLMGEMGSKYETAKTDLLQNPGILNISAVDRLPMYEGSGTSNAEWEGKPADFKVQMRVGSVDYDFLDTFKLEMVDGRFFSREITGDKTQGIVINESAVEAMGLENPIGKRFSFSQRKDGRVIGVIKDFQLRSFHYEVEPMFLFLEPSWFSYLCVKIRSENVSETLKFLEENWKRYNPQYPFEFGFFDEAIDGLYRSEVRVGKIFQYFTVLAIFISCLGLFGLASFMAQRRTKEIGIRKILGASGTRICLLLSREFLKWVILANFIAWPIAYIFMQQWLQNFAFRINIGLWIFAFSAGLSLFITILTISYQSIKSAFSNPVESLRYE